MTNRISPTSDLAVKKTLAERGNEDVLQGMIGDFFGIRPAIEDITITEHYNIEAYEEYVKKLNGNEEISEKLRQTIQDVAADIKIAGVGVEVQVKSDLYFTHRSLYYLCSRFCSNYNLTGKMVKRYDGKFIKYSSLKPVYALNIIGYNHFPDDDALRVLTFYDRKRNKSLDREYLIIAYFELAKNNIETVNQKHWQTYFKTGEASNDAPEYIKKAARIIERANMTQKERDMIEQLQRAEDINDSVIYTAQIEGERKRELEIVRNMLKRNKPISEIIEDTGVSREEVEKERHRMLGVQ